MPPMLGDRILPEAVQSRRRRLRSRLQAVREPVRSFREQNVPGPDVVGKLERQTSSLRNRVVSRDAVLSRIRDMRSDGDNSSDSSSSNNSGSRNATIN